MSKLIVDRATWVNGRYDADSRIAIAGPIALLNDQGFRCCLGFYAAAIGFTDEQILCVGEPRDIDDLLLPRNEDGDYEFGSLGRHDVDKLINENDDCTTDDAAREKAIAECFAVRGIEVEFVGEYPQIGSGE